LPAQAQTARSALEAARCAGLHAAAHRGDMAALKLALAAKSDVDAHGRRPLHVAAFAMQEGAIRALAQAGADLGALENDRCDVVTIAAVAHDEVSLRVLLELGASVRLTPSR